MSAQLAMADQPEAPIVTPPRIWTVCARAEPTVPDWYEVQSKWCSALPDEWRTKDDYCRSFVPQYWNGTQWCISENDHRPAPDGTTYPGNPQDRWRPVPVGFVPESVKREKPSTEKW